MSTGSKPWISDKSFFWLVTGISIAVLSVVVMLRFLPEEWRPAFYFAKQLPKVNAIINTLVSICLIMGYYAIRVRKNKPRHQFFMLSSFILSSLFLVSYVLYHYTSKHVEYGGDGVLKIFYLTILASHIILAAIILPLVLYTLYWTSIGRFDKHKRWARITFPIWLYVSITGVLVYLLISPYINQSL